MKSSSDVISSMPGGGVRRIDCLPCKVVVKKLGTLDCPNDARHTSTGTRQHLVGSCESSQLDLQQSKTQDTYQCYLGALADIESEDDRNGKYDKNKIRDDINCCILLDAHYALHRRPTAIEDSDRDKGLSRYTIGIGRPLPEPNLRNRHALQYQRSFAANSEHDDEALMLELSVEFNGILQVPLTYHEFDETCVPFPLHKS